MEILQSCTKPLTYSKEVQHHIGWCPGSCCNNGYPSKTSANTLVILQSCTKPSNSVFMKIIRHIGHFRWLGPNVWWGISQIWKEYIKPIKQMSDESWKFFGYTATYSKVSRHHTGWYPESSCNKGYPFKTHLTLKSSEIFFPITYCFVVKLFWTFAKNMAVIQHKELGYQQTWYWFSSPRIFWFQHQRG